MALRKPTADAHQLYTATSADFRATAYTVCGWFNFAAFPANGQLYRAIQVGVSGCFLKVTPATTLLFGYATGGGFAIGTRLHGLGTGVDAFLLGQVDAAGTGLLRVNATESAFGGGGALVNTGNPDDPTVLNDALGAQPTQAAFGGLWVYGRALALVEREEIYVSKGARCPVTGLISHLTGHGVPGTTTATAIPVDLANPARVWAMQGAGNAYAYEAALSPETHEDGL